MKAVVMNGLRDLICIGKNAKTPRGGVIPAVSELDKTEACV